MRVVVVLAAAVAITSSQIASGASPAPANHRGSQSVRPTTGEIRTAVDGLLGWHVGIFGNVFPTLTFSESAVLTDALGLANIGGDNSQEVSPQISKKLDFHLSPEDVDFVKRQLDSLGLKMTAYRVDTIPSDEAWRQKLFAFAKELGAETIITSAMPSSLPELDSLAGKSGINVAIESQCSIGYGNGRSAALSLASSRAGTAASGTAKRMCQLRPPLWRNQTVIHRIGRKSMANRCRNGTASGSFRG